MLNEPMRGLSLWEPWASLVACGAKEYETRGWSTSYRGPLLICAAKGGLARGDLQTRLSLPNFQAGLAPLVGKPLDLENRDQQNGVGVEHLSFGCAIALVDVVDCVGTESFRRDEVPLSLAEWSFGDFGPGRFAWKLANVRRLELPVPVKGRQRLFNVPEEIARQVFQQTEQPANTSQPEAAEKVG